MDLFSDDENFWNGNEENELISIDSLDESIQSELTSNDESTGEATPRKKSRKIVYKEEAKFDSEQSFEEWLREEKQSNWTRLFQENSINTNNNCRWRQRGSITTYRCKFSQKKGYRCNMKLQIFRSQRSNHITAEISDGTHTHFPNENTPLEGHLKLTAEIKILINRFHNQEGKTPAQIRNRLIEVCRNLYLHL